MKVLEVKNLCKKYKGTEVIKDVSFSVEEGETIAIIGASGSGKSTLLRCIANLEKINYGNITINGESLVKEYKKNKPVYNDKQILQKINLETGMVFQEFNLFPHLSVLENVTTSLINVLKMDKTEADKKAMELLRKMGLEEKADVYPCSLSGGQKQRVSIARCLTLEPKIICMDEPTSALDPELVGEVLKVIKSLAKEKRTMIIVTHEIKFAEEVADRVIFMDEGIIAEEGPAKEVIKNPRKLRTIEFLKRYINVEGKMEKLSLDKEEPKDVLKFFAEISKIPRKSGNEKEVKNYLVNFAKERGLDFYEDKNYNVIIKKQASKGKENAEPIALQAHTDMICEKIEGSKHNFEKDGVELYKENGYIRAKETTLGADNGIGVAQILAILDNDDLMLPKIEAIFTVQEETTMIGAKEIDLSGLESKQIISLDGGREGEILINSANCLEWQYSIDKEYVEVPKNYVEYELIYSNFKGGHSGGNIGDVRRGNPIKLGIEALNVMKDVYISYVEGGSRVNVIPRDFKVKFFMKKSELKKIEKIIQEQKEFYGDVNIEINEAKSSNIKANKVQDKKQNNTQVEGKNLKTEKRKVLSQDVTQKIIGFISEYSNGALKYENEQAILSCNMAVVNEDKDKIYIEFSTRANDINLRNEYLKELSSKIEKYKLNLEWNQELKGVNQPADCKLVQKCDKVFKQMYQKEIKKIISQGVVEGGFFVDKLPDVEYVCIGPDTEDAHSPNERLNIESLKRTYEFLQNILKI